MTPKVKAHFVVAVAVNLLLVSFILKATWDGNDKAIILVLFLYPIIILINSLVWWALNKKHKSASKIYRAITLGLIVLFLPVLMLASSY